MAERKPVTSEEGEPNPPSLGQVYPAIARWVSGYGWVEFGIDGLDRPFIRALDEGGRVWEGEGKYETLDQALQAMEAGLTEFMREQGFDTTSSSDQRSAKRSTQRPRKSASKAAKDRRRAAGIPRQLTGRAGKHQPRSEDEQKAIKKVERLDKIAEELRQGGHFSVTRLTTLKGLCEDPKAAGAFARFLARKIQERMRQKETPQRYRDLVNRAVREMKPDRDDPAEERKERLSSLFHEIEAEQNEYRHISWGMVRLVKSMDLIVVEHCLRAVLRSYEASFWLYQAARDYTGHTDVLVPSSAPRVEEIAGFWRNHLGIQRR
ncbi:MAG: hypothetical protein JO034_12685 [Singulisphaera sp.]|nr:hypothetical protein [Singulisphaera sp.]